MICFINVLNISYSIKSNLAFNIAWLSILYGLLQNVNNAGWIIKVGVEFIKDMTMLWNSSFKQVFVDFFLCQNGDSASAFDINHY